MFYTPQHGLSCALGLLALVPVALGGRVGPARIDRGQRPAAGVGDHGQPVSGRGLLADLRAGDPRRGGDERARRSRRSCRHAVAAAPPALAASVGHAQRNGRRRRRRRDLGWAGHARHAPVVTLLMSLGPVLVPALAGPACRRVACRRRRSCVAVSGLLVGLWLLYFVVLSEASWVGFRAGQILLALITIPLARLLATLGDWSTTAISARRGRGAGRRHPRHRGADGRRRYLQRIGHREPGSGARVSVDADGDARPAGRARLGEAAHAADGRRPDGRPGARPRPLELHPDLRGPAHGCRTAHLLAAAPGVPAGVTTGARDLRQPRCRDKAHLNARRLGIDYLWVDDIERRTYPRWHRRSWPRHRATSRRYSTTARYRCTECGKPQSV